MTVQNIGIAFINQLVDYYTTETFIKVNSAEFPRKTKYKKKKERQECNKNVQNYWYNFGENFVKKFKKIMIYDILYCVVFFFFLIVFTFY